MRILLDTNVLAAALGTRGFCADLLAVVIEEHELVTCEALMNELDRVLREKFRLPDALIDEFLTFIKAQSVHVQGDTNQVVSPDPDDAPIIAAALEARACFMATGDKALLGLPSTGSLRIVSPRTLFETLQDPP